MSSNLRWKTAAWLAAAWLALTAGLTRAVEPNAPRGEADRVAQWIEDLGHPEYVVRSRAEAELAALGFAAFDALTVAEENPDLEIAQRARFLLRSMTARWVRDGDPPAVKQILERYEQLSDPQRAEAMEQLGLLPDDAGTSALCRLARYEKSPLLSKRAAIEVMFLPQASGPAVSNRAAVIEGELGTSPRTASNWLRTYVRAGSGDRAALDTWAKLAEEEYQQFELAPDETDVQIVALMLYAYGQACAAAGDAARAEQISQRAWSLQPHDLAAHYLVARQLAHRGLFEWSEREYRRLIEQPFTGDPRSLAFAMSSRIRLAEMLHDQGRELPAAEVMEGLVAMMDDQQSGAEVKRRLIEELVRDPEGIRSRAQYFRALHLLSEGRREEALARLDKGLEEDFADADVLIALYELSADDPERRSRTLAQVAKAAAEYRQDIEKMPQDHQGYNQLAWLLANTGGDAVEAARLSHRSLELAPDTASYLDTLAHCYYAQGDFALAVKHQTRAAELDPHSGLIRKKLEVFRGALADANH